jgi:oligopeptide transport system permease protein
MVIEQICNLPGLGKDFITAAFNRDYTLIAGVMIVYAVILVGMNLLVDITYALLDPRVSYGQV